MRILFLIGAAGSELRHVFRARVLQYTREVLFETADSVTLAVTERPPPPVSVIPFRRDMMALVSLDGDRDWVMPERRPGGFLGAFRSEAAWPVVHRRTWPTGSASPGVGLLTIFRKRPDIDDREFLRRWYDGHTPLTLEVHPNVGYVRNRVIGRIADADAGVDVPFDSPDGIVEEQYDPPADLLRPWRFFGGSGLSMLPTMLTVYRDIRRFIDYSSIRTWLTTEYRLKDGDGADRHLSG